MALLQRANVLGLVFPAANGWVSFVYSGGVYVGETANRDRLLDANRGLLVSYEYFEEGCEVQVFQDAHFVAEASFERKKVKFDKDDFVALGLLSPAAASEVETWLKKAHEGVQRGPEQYVVARCLGLPRYAWFSFAYEYRDEDDDESAAPGRI